MCNVVVSLNCKFWCLVLFGCTLFLVLRMRVLCVSVSQCHIECSFVYLLFHPFLFIWRLGVVESRASCRPTKNFQNW